MIITTFRQGDILFKQVEELPSGLIEQHSPILVEGEVTGHAHRVESLATVHILMGLGMLMYLHVIQTTRIMHEEHHPILVLPGLYQIIRQREYTPEAIRTVLD